MQSIEPKPGQVIELELAKSKDEMMQFRTLIEEVKGDLEFTLLAPMYKAMPYPFRDDEVVDFIFTVHDEENTPSAFIFKARITERFKKEDLTYLRVVRISGITKLQRRGYYRLNYVADMEYEVLQSENDRDTYTCKRIITKDVSAGGFCGIISEHLPPGGFIRLHLVLGEDKFLINARIINTSRFEESVLHNEIRCIFCPLSSKETGRLIQAINNMQSEYIRRMAGTSLEDRLRAYGHGDMMFSERRISNDWVVKWLDWSVIVTWVISFIIMANTMLAMPQRPNTIDNYYGYIVRRTWDMERIQNNIYFLLALFIVSSISLILNSTRMKRAGDRYRVSLMVMGVLSLMLILAYLFYF